MKSRAYQTTPTPVLDLLPSLLTTKTNRPPKAHLGVNGQNHFRKLNLTDAVIQSRAQLGHFWVFVLCGQWRQMEFIIHAQYATAVSYTHLTLPTSDLV